MKIKLLSDVGIAWTENTANHCAVTLAKIGAKFKENVDNPRPYGGYTVYFEKGTILNSRVLTKITFDTNKYWKETFSKIINDGYAVKVPWWSKCGSSSTSGRICPGSN